VHTQTLSGCLGLALGLTLIFASPSQASISTRHYHEQLKREFQRSGLSQPQLLPVKQRQPLFILPPETPTDWNPVEIFPPFPLDSELAGRVKSVTGTFPEREIPFLTHMVNASLHLQQDYGIPASATISMAIYESAYGRSALARIYHNCFGIKAFQNWPGNRVRMKTRDSGVWTEADFRAYPSFHQGVLNFAEFLSRSPRYEDAFHQKESDDFVRELLASGYCPDDDYHQNILRIMERYQLRLLDFPTG